MAERRTFLLALATGAGGAGLVAIAGNNAWVVPESDTGTGAIAQVAATAADASAPLATAVALVVLAAWGVIGVTRGRFRRGVAWLIAVASAALMVVVMLAWVQAPDQLREMFASYGVSDAAVKRTAWCWAAVAGAAVALVGAALAVRDVAAWPAMGSRYDAPGSSAAAEEAVEEQSSTDIWKALDEGEDPTTN